MDFWEPKQREAVQAMILRVEDKPCVNVDAYDGRVYVCGSSRVWRSTTTL
ncbi:hypothetical protein [Singulisphaera sp. PoT]